MRIEDFKKLFPYVSISTETNRSLLSKESDKNKIDFKRLEKVAIKDIICICHQKGASYYFTIKNESKYPIVLLKDNNSTLLKMKYNYIFILDPKPKKTPKRFVEILNPSRSIELVEYAGEPTLAKAGLQMGLGLLMLPAMALGGGEGMGDAFADESNWLEGFDASDVEFIVVNYIARHLVFFIPIQ